MTCETARELMLEFEPPGGELSSHLAGCDGCRNYWALQRSLDERLAEAFKAPALPPTFRAGVESRIRTATRKQRWEALPPLIAPCAGLLTSGACALVAPEAGMFLLTIGIVLSAVGYLGQVLFIWLIEELGEG